MLGPWSETMTISTSAGSPARPSSASRTAVVTSIVFASASLTMDTPTLGLPFVREMLFGAAAPRLTSATSPRRTGPASDIPTTRPSRSSMELKVCVVLARTACPPSKIAPAGRLTLLSLRADDIWNSETPFAASLSASTVICTRRSISPVAWTCRIPSTSESAGRTLDSTIPCRSAASRSEMTLNWMTGNWSGLKRPTVGSSTPLTNEISFTTEAMWVSAAAMSVPYLKVASTSELPSKVVVWTDSNPAVPEIARSIGAVTSRTMASGFADG